MLTIARDRQQRKKALDGEIRTCHRCPGMNIPGETQAAPGWGSLRSPVVIVGESPCHPCMVTQQPFTGGAERILAESFKLADVTKRELFITNTVHCHPHSAPRDNRDPHPHELLNCRPFLHRELRMMQPRLVIGLGRYAQAALRSEYRGARELPSDPFSAPRTRQAQTPDLLLLKHPYWIMTRPRSVREQYVNDLAAALRWAFREY